MKDEIKEILDVIYDENVNGFLISDDKLKKLRDYITNLQKYYNDNVNKYEELIEKYSNLQYKYNDLLGVHKIENNDIQNLLDRIDKAIKYIMTELIDEWAIKNNGYVSGSDLPVDAITPLLDILQGEGKE